MSEAQVIKEYRVDRTGWPHGEWDNEPDDRLEWRSRHGVPCLMVRNHFGAWCGYAAVAPGHPWHGKVYNHEDVTVDVHGGLTYSATCQSDGGPICHVPQPGEPDPVWWFGFDTAHAYDLAPGLLCGGVGPYDVYRTREYVRREVESLAQQIVEAGTMGNDETTASTVDATEPTKKKSTRGFGSPRFSRERQREIASKGGRAAHLKGTAHQWTSEEARSAGRKGGLISRGGKGRAPSSDAPTASQGA